MTIIKLVFMNSTYMIIYSFETVSTYSFTISTYSRTVQMYSCMVSTDILVNEPEEFKTINNSRLCMLVMSTSLSSTSSYSTILRCIRIRGQMRTTYPMNSYIFEVNCFIDYASQVNLYSFRFDMQFYDAYFIESGISNSSTLCSTGYILERLKEVNGL